MWQAFSAVANFSLRTLKFLSSFRKSLFVCTLHVVL